LIRILFEELVKLGCVAPAGLAAFERRDAAKDLEYSYERERCELSAAFRKRLKGKAREFFAEQPPGYRKLAAFWVMSAKKEETRERRFAVLLRDSERGRRLAAFVPRKRK